MKQAHIHSTQLTIQYGCPACNNISITDIKPVLDGMEKPMIVECPHCRTFLKIADKITLRFFAEISA